MDNIHQAQMQQAPTSAGTRSRGELNGRNLQTTPSSIPEAKPRCTRKNEAPRDGDRTEPKTNRRLDCSTIRVPQDLPSATPKVLATLARDICKFVRVEAGVGTDKSAEYHLYEERIMAVCEELHLAELFENEEAYEAFLFELAPMWPYSLTDLKYQMEEAINSYLADPEAYRDPRLRLSGYRRAATFCWRLAQADPEGNGVFYLSSRTLETITGIPKSTGYRILTALVKPYGILEVLAPGKPKIRLSTTYRFKRWDT